MLEKYEDVLNPCKLVWPDYGTKELLLDSDSYVYVSLDTLEKLDSFIEKRVEFIKNHQSKKNWINFTDKIVDAFILELKEGERNEELLFKKETVYLHDKTSITVKQLFDRIIKNTQVYDKLVDRLSQKYLIDEEVAKIWIIEYARYL